MTLDKITSETCVNQAKALRLSYCSEHEGRCRVCNDYNSCPDYKPLSATQISFRRGALAVYNFWYQNISIRGLP